MELTQDFILSFFRQNRTCKTSGQVSTQRFEKGMGTGLTFHGTACDLSVLLLALSLTFMRLMIILQDMYKVPTLGLKVLNKNNCIEYVYFKIKTVIAST